MKEKNINKRRMVIYAIVLFFLLIGCNDSDTTDLISNNSNLEMNPAEDVEGHLEEGVSGVGFGLEPYNFEWDWDVDGPFNGTLDLEDPSDFIVANVENISIRDRNFVLKIFLNYESIPFQVVGEDEFSSTFFFSITSGYQMAIPFVIDPNLLEDEMFKLTAAVFANPEYHVATKTDDMERLRLSFSPGTVLNFDLFFGERWDIELTVPPHTVLSQRENEQHTYLRISTQLDVEDFHQIGYSEPMMVLEEGVLQVSPGEEIDLAFFANLYRGERMDVNEYVILALLDWEQIELSGNPYLLMEVPEHDFNQLVEYGHFTFVAPDEVGMYEFVAMVIPNPREINTFDHFWPIEMSERFTIEVVE